MLITILDPRAAMRIPETPYALSCDTSRRGLRIGLLSNCFFDASNLLTSVGEALSGLLDAPEVELRFQDLHLRFCVGLRGRTDAGPVQLLHGGIVFLLQARDARLDFRRGFP